MRSVVAGAVVTIRTIGNVVWGTTTTDASGHYRYPAPAGSYNITASAANLTDKTVYGFVINGGRSTNTLGINLIASSGCSLFWLPVVGK